MKYLLRLTDSANQRMVLLTLDERLAKQAAIDVVFDVVGNEQPAELVDKGVIEQGQLDDLIELQQIIFDKDEQGLLIRDSVNFKANGKELNPDAPLIKTFVPAEHDGTPYMRLDLTVEGGAQSATPEAGPKTTEDLIKEFGRVLFLHQIGIGFAIDVTREYPELIDVIKYAESKGWIKVDVKNVKYKLTPDGKRVHDQYIEEAQDLIKRYDIYADVDIDSSGQARFDTGLGKDLRVPAFELAGVDPFRARFLLGLNDGEWDKQSDWFELFEDPKWYASIFAPIETAPSIEDIGRDRMTRIMDQAKAKLRQDQPGQFAGDSY